MVVVVGKEEVLIIHTTSSTLHDSTIREASPGRILMYPNDTVSTRITITVWDLLLEGSEPEGEGGG